MKKAVKIISIFFVFSVLVLGIACTKRRKGETVETTTKPREQLSTKEREKTNQEVQGKLTNVSIRKKAF